MTGNREVLVEIAQTYRAAMAAGSEVEPLDEDDNDGGEVVTDVQPTEKATGRETLKAFNLTLTGEGFSDYTTITLDGVAVPTTLKSDTQVFTVMAPHKEPLRQDQVIEVSTTAAEDQFKFIWLATVPPDEYE